MRPIVIGLLPILACVVASAQMKDYQGYQDPALFTRMPHYYLASRDSFVEKAFDAYAFTGKNGTQQVEGRHLFYAYSYDEAAGTPPGFLQIVRNYEAAARKIGGQVLSEDVRRVAIRIVKDGTETWVAVEAFNDGRDYELHIIERQAMKQDVVADAAALQSGLKANGHVEAPGIFFDTGKSEIKPESGPALKELTALLQANPALKVWIVGHTDTVGSVESNMALSSARAASVVKSLVARGIAANRMAPHGAGPFAPVASNEAEEGRARNRRVELVSQP